MSARNFLSLSAMSHGARLSRGKRLKEVAGGYPQTAVWKPGFPGPSLVLLLLLLLALISCAPAAAPTPTVTVPPVPTVAPAPAVSFPLMIRDSLGRDITVEKPPGRIISLSPAHTETLYAIGAGDRVVGTDDYSDYPPEAKSTPKVGYSNLDIEKIVSLQPDLVYAATRQKRFVPEMEKVGLKVLYLEEPQSIEGVFGQIKDLGRTTNHLREAETLVDQMQEKTRAIQEKLASRNTGPRVFYELTPGLFTTSPNSFIGDLFRTLKGQNIAEGIDSPYPQLSLEALVAKDPEVIILADAATYGQGKESPSSVKQRPSWGGISAVKSNRVYEIDANLVSRPGPRIVEGLERLAKMLYPELFP